MPRPIPIHLTLQDVKTMITCKAQLDAVVAVLAQSNWSGARAVQATLGIVDMFICDLYNRAEPHWVAYLNRGSAAPVAPTPSEPGPSVPGGSPAGAVLNPGGKV